jgi:hypothetical protein
VGIFFLGAGVTCYHGVMGLLHPHVLENIPVVSDCYNIVPRLVHKSLSISFLYSQALSVLGASAVVEGGEYMLDIK